jgi:hypothetical protein
MADENEKKWVVTIVRENWWRVLLFLLLCANLWLGRTYVTREEYNSDRTKTSREEKENRDKLDSTLQDLVRTVQELKTAIAVREAANNDKWVLQQIADHEARLREIERKGKIN